jgi:hypothetical protein
VICQFIKTAQNVRLAALMPALLAGLFSAHVLADEPSVGSTNSVSPLNGLSLISDSSEPVARAGNFPMVLDPSADFQFDLGGSDTAKLQLQLARPLSLQAGTQARVLDNGSNLLGLDATLAVPAGDGLTMTARTQQSLGNARFQSLGSIQCMNGVLRADSYTASGCHFVNEPIAAYEQQRFDLGLQLDIGDASASVNWFQQQAGVNQPMVQRLNQPAVSTVAGAGLLSPGLGNPLFGNTLNNPLAYMNAETSGVDLNFKVGITTDSSGDIQLGLAFARVLEAEYQGLYARSADQYSWTTARPFNSVELNLEWSRGAFSGGIAGFYRDSVDFLNRNSIDDLTTFDVHFTWRTPWNANLTVGTSNVLDAGAEVSTNADAQPVDPLESIYGRIPYVRYKQDL